MLLREFYFWYFINCLEVLVKAQNEIDAEVRPYEYGFNIADFQHRYEKKDDDGLITGEYGFLTGDGVYHETGYATDKDGDFIITKMKHRRISNLQDAREIFKDQPEIAKLVVDTLAKSCTDCKIFVNDENIPMQPIPQLQFSPTNKAELEKKFNHAMREMMNILIDKKEKLATENFKKTEFNLLRKENEEQSRAPIKTLNVRKNSTSDVIRDMIVAGKKALSNNESENERVQAITEEALEKMASDLFYRFNYTITSHGHREDGFRDGRKNGAYSAKGPNGIDTHVKYTSNEFGFQPNITLIPQLFANFSDEAALRGYYLNWFRK